MYLYELRCENVFDGEQLMVSELQSAQINVQLVDTVGDVQCSAGALIGRAQSGLVHCLDSMIKSMRRHLAVHARRAHLVEVATQCKGRYVTGAAQ